jgi:ABC-type transport system involved in multi-copper enzyme maturation permease subunit
MIVLRQVTNPIEWQEIEHQKRRTAAPLPYSRWLLPLLLVIMVGAVALTLRKVDQPTRELALLVIWICHGLTAAGAIAVGANAISREHDGQTWIPLILTGVSARRILIGKWLGVLHKVAPWMLALGTVRLVMLPIFTFAFINRFAWRMSTRFSYAPGTPSYYAYDPYLVISWLDWAALLAVVMSVVLTVLEVLCCTALGLAASAVIKRGWLALIVGICIRFTPVFLFAAFTRYEVGLAPSWQALRFTPLALADSGSAPLYQLSLPLTSWTMGTHETALSGVVLTTAMLVLFLTAALAVAWSAVRTAGALPEAKPETTLA